MNIQLTEEELNAIVDAYKYRNDESYAVAVAYTIWDKLIEMGVIKDDE